jgi:cell division protein FtsN
LLLSGCLPPVLQVASWTVSGVSYMFSGKGIGDHMLSLAAEQDCATWRVLQGKRICVDYDKKYENGWEAVASTFKAPTDGSVDNPQDDVTDSPVQVASAADESALLDTAYDDDGAVAVIENETNEPSLPNNVAAIATVKELESIAPAAGPSKDLTSVDVQPEKTPEKTAAVANVNPTLMVPVSVEDGTDNGIYLVIGSFRSNQRAIKLQARHTDMDTAIMQARISGKSLYRVLAGPIGKSDLTAARRTLSKGGVRHSWAVRLCKATLTPTPCVSSVQQASLR